MKKLQFFKRILLGVAVCTFLAAPAGFQSEANADIVANFNSFSFASGDTELSTDSSAQTLWTTSSLMDQATGNGAGGSNLNGNNRLITSIASTDVLLFSANRENATDSSGPTATVGETTWMEFGITASAGNLLDFNGQEATVDTFASSGLGGNTDGIWFLYYSLDGGATFTNLGPQNGQGAGPNETNQGPTAVSWDLSAIGSVDSVDFVFDVVSTDATNGTVSQRGIGFGNFVVNANISAVPEPGTALFLLAGLGIGCVVRRNRR